MYYIKLKKRYSHIEVIQWYLSNVTSLNLKPFWRTTPTPDLNSCHDSLVNPPTLSGTKSTFETIGVPVPDMST